MKSKQSKSGPRPAVTRTGRWKPRFIESLAQTGNVTVSATVANVQRGTIYATREKDKEFAAAMDDALAQACDTLESEARRRAVDGLVQKKFTKGGDPIIDPETGEQYIERAYSDTLLIFLLKAGNPKKFRETHHHTHDGNLGLKTVADGEAEADQLLAELRRISTTAPAAASVQKAD